jgi:hypothetical protein
MASRALFSAGSVTGKVAHSRAVYVFGAVILLACILIYGVSLNGPLFFDDDPNLLSNNKVQVAGTAVDDWRVAALSSDSGFLYRPIAMLTFALNHVVSGSFSAFSLKATNLAIHMFIGVLVYGLALALLSAPALRVSPLKANQRQLVAVIAASLWLLHPLHVSTVLYAVQRMAQLPSLFTLAGLLVFTRYRLRWAAKGAGPGEVLAAFLWLLILGVFAVLSKENGAVLPWLIAVVEVTLFQGVWRGQSQARLERFGWVVFVLPLLLLILLCVVPAGLLPWSYGNRHFTLEERLLTQSRILWQYLSWMLVPNILDMGFFHDDIPLSRGLWSPLTTALSLIAWVGVVGAALWWRRKYPLFVFAVLFYLVAHSIESSVLPLELVFEHRNYLPSVGLAILAAFALMRFFVRFNQQRQWFALCGIVGILATLLFVRTHAWSDEMTLARFNVVNHPNSARANFFYANALFKRFELSRELDLPEDEQRALAVTSRRYFERMYALDDQAFAALVMLYQLDVLYFPGLAEKNDWLDVMEGVIASQRLTSSDITALGALAKISSTPLGESGRAQVEKLLDDLIERYPSRIALLAFRIQMRSIDGSIEGVEAKRWLAMVERAVQMNPGSREPLPYLVHLHGNADLASTYEAILEWIRRDPLRRDLRHLRRILGH